MNPDDNTNSSPPPNASESDTQPPLAVVINDDVTQLRVATAVLQKAGLRVNAYDGADKALTAMLHSPPPDVIVTDVCMPVIDGWRLCRLLRSPEFASLNNVPILVSSATFKGIDAQQITRDLGANSFLAVPYRPSELVQHVRHLIDDENCSIAPTVLMIDENQARLELVGRVFKDHGYTCVTATGADQAWTILENLSPDIIVTGQMGRRIDKSILMHKLAEKGSPMVIDFVPSEIDGDRLVSLMKEGVDATVREPIDPDEVIAVCERARRERSMIQIEQILEERMLSLRDSEAKHRSVLNNVSNPIITTDDDQTILYSNRAFAELIGTRPEQVEGCALSKVMPEGWPVWLGEQYDRQAWLDGDDVRSSEGNLGNRTFHATLNRTPWGILSVFADVTDQRTYEKKLKQAKEAAEAANQFKSEFLANMSHEIRTPMTAILGYTDFVRNENLDPAVRTEYLDSVQRNGEHLLALLNDILDLSKIEAGKMSVERVACSVPQLVNDVVSIMQDRANTKGLNLAVEYVWPVPEMIHTDPTRLRQILINLVGNSIKFTEQGGLRVVVRYSTHDDGADQLRFEVIDTGIGMTAQQQARIFEPFTQADASTTRRFGGTGLGLAICKRLAEILGGDIKIESNEHQGSSFIVSIDPGEVRMATSSQQFHKNHTAQPKKPTGSPTTIKLPHKRVLLAEDGLDNQRLICHILKQAGLEIEIAENGKIACEKFEQAKHDHKPFDVVLMDMQMPEVDGYQATRILRSQGFDGPIIALTAHAMAGDRKKCIEAGCSDYATKPIDRIALLTLLADEFQTQDAA